MNPFQSFRDYEAHVYTLRHIPPDIKYHRIPAPNMSFTRPNLPVLIQEVEELIRQENETDTPNSNARAILKSFVHGKKERWES